MGFWITLLTSAGFGDACRLQYGWVVATHAFGSLHLRVIAKVRMVL
jgi:hypothetical protein